jgi:nucleotide-binding universal stress UspA family protein
MFENVVVGVRDMETGRDATALAGKLVFEQGVLTLLHVDLITTKPAPDSGSVGDARRRRYALERLTLLAAEFAPAATIACVEARSAKRGLDEFASDRSADLLVIGASHNDDLARAFIADDTRALLEDAPCAVAVAPAGYAERADPIRRIGVAYDGSGESERALSWGRRLAAERHAELSAFEAVPAPVYARDPWNLEGEVSEHVEKARERVAALGGLQAEAGFGDAVEELAQYAQSVDLLVLGSHRYRPFDRLLQQSTSQQLADVATSPLLVLPHGAHGANDPLP